MNDFENQLDEIRVRLYQETEKLDKEDLIKAVNSHAQMIASEFGINIKTTANEKYFQTVNI
jgi:hypothetical protein